MIDGFEMVAKRFAANRNTVLNDFRRFTQCEGISGIMAQLPQEVNRVHT
jgi:hypothetical protein